MMNYCCPMCGGSTNTAGNFVNWVSPVVYRSTTVKCTDYCAEHDTHHIGGCFQCSQRTKDKRIAELEAELERVNAYCQEMENRNWKGDRVAELEAELAEAILKVRAIHDKWREVATKTEHEWYNDAGSMNDICDELMDIFAQTEANEVE